MNQLQETNLHMVLLDHYIQNQQFCIVHEVVHLLQEYMNYQMSVQEGIFYHHQKRNIKICPLKRMIQQVHSFQMTF